ncbi:MAG: DUF2167 domain-containing protein [Deltaproteobacteria bacterium]
MRSPYFALLALSLLTTRAALAETPPADVAAAGEEDPLAQFAWQMEGQGKLGSRATLEIPQGFRFLEAAEASRLVEAMGNLTSRKEVGLIATHDLEWFVVFFFDDVGYVKDDEKDELDADDMAESMAENLQYSNEERRDRGLEELSFDGWAIPPRYNETSNRLEWAHRLRSATGVSVNYNTRVLGRHGVMRVILVTDPELLEATLPQYNSLMSGFDFTSGERYAEYRQGDKIAEYGLIALVAGGGAAVAAKTGLLTALVAFFKKGAKLIIVGLAAAAAFVKKLFSGRRD